MRVNRFVGDRNVKHANGYTFLSVKVGLASPPKFMLHANGIKFLSCYKSSLYSIKYFQKTHQADVRLILVYTLNRCNRMKNN
jgi:hypothetical protein